MELTDSQTSDVDEPCPSFHRYSGRLGSFLAEDNIILIVVLATILVEGHLLSDACVSFAKHPPIGVIVFVEACCAPRELTDEVFWVVFDT